MSRQTKVKVALAQLTYSLGNVQANLVKAKEVIKQATKNEGVDIVCFPELFSTGYILNEEVFELAETIPGPTFEIFQQEAKEHGVTLIFGMAEYDRKGIIYNSAVLVEPTGLLQGKYRKTHLWGNESKYFTAGHEYPVYKTNLGTIGVAICYDIEFPEVARILTLKGAEIIVCLAANPVSYEYDWDIYLRSRALENGVFIVGVNSVGKGEALTFHGDSKVVEPNGQVISSAGDEEILLIATLDLNKVQTQRKRLPYLRDRSPETYFDLTEISHSVQS